MAIEKLSLRFLPRSGHVSVVTENDLGNELYLITFRTDGTIQCEGGVYDDDVHFNVDGDRVALI